MQSPTPEREPRVPAEPDALIEELRQHFAAAAADGIDAIYQVRIAGVDAVHFRVANRTLTPLAGSHGAPHLTLEFSDDRTAVAAVRGELDIIEAFLHGRVRADGHLVLAMRALLFLFAPGQPDQRAQLT